MGASKTCMMACTLVLFNNGHKQSYKAGDPNDMKDITHLAENEDLFLIQGPPFALAARASRKLPGYYKGKQVPFHRQGGEPKQFDLNEWKDSKWWRRSEAKDSTDALLYPGGV